MGQMGVQCMHQRRTLLDDPHPRVAMAVDPTLMTLGQAKPTLQIKVVLDLIHGVTAGEQPGLEPTHHPGHVLMDRIVVSLEAREDLIEVGLTRARGAAGGGQGRGDLGDGLDVALDRLAIRLHQLQADVDPDRQSAQLRLREPPFFAAKFRSIDSRTSSNASAIRIPGGWSGPPWSSLRMPRTAEQ
jgi:hypothetical protein